MNHFWQTVYDHRFAVGSVAWYVFSAAVVSLPPDDEEFKFFPWFSRTLHLMLNIKPIPSLRQVEQTRQVSDSSGATKTEAVKTTE